MWITSLGEKIMSILTRRDLMKGTLATVAGAGMLSGSSAATASSAQSRPSAGERKNKIKLALMAGGGDLQTIGLQMGVTHVITGARGLRRGGSVDEFASALLSQKDGYARMGIKIAGFEGPPINNERIKRGDEGRDEDIEDFNNSIIAMSQAGLDMICYNWMVNVGWTRSSQAVPDRGGALTSEFDLEAYNNPDTSSRRRGRMGFGGFAGRGGATQGITEEQVWDNLEYFLKAVIPVADKYKVKMALHPDDPPVPMLGNNARILTSAANYRKIMDMVPSQMNGITFCQGNFKLMGEDIYALAEEWCKAKKIFFVHFRDVEGTKEKFHETFHDNGPTDMARMMKIYSDYGFDGPIRPDHAPAMGSETASGYSSGYGSIGKVFAIGYMIGLLQAQGLPYE
jgi:mannonate dehydratase